MARPNYEYFWHTEWDAHGWGSFSLTKWLASFGVTLAVADVVWSHLNPHVFRPVHFLMALYFLKCYMPEEAACAHFGVSAKTYSHHVWRVIRALNASMQQIDLSQRFHDVCPGTAWLSVDTTFCPIDVALQPWWYQGWWYSGYKKVHCLKYEVGVHAWTGEILWINGPYVGPESDADICRAGGLLNYLLPHEYFYADKAYQGVWHALTPFRGPDEGLTLAQWNWNRYLNSVRVRVENSINRIVHKFRALSYYWQHDVHSHAEAFFCAAQIAAVDICLNPIRKDFYEVWPRPVLYRL